jgi:hypothetical protein
MNFVQLPSRPTPKDRDDSNGSPVSIISNIVPDQPTSVSPSIVVMSDDGAEVTLGTAEMDIDQPMESSPPRKVVNPSVVKVDTVAQTPVPASVIERRFIIGTLPTHSLMDDEASPSPRTPQKTRSRIMNLWCDNQNFECYKFDEEDGLAVTNQTMENTINKFLGSSIGPHDWCASWQAWTYFEMDHGADDRVLGLKDDIKRVLRNRAGNMDSRTSRITNLKKDLCPFAATPKRKGAPISKAASFCQGASRHSKLPKHVHHNSFSSLPSAMFSCMEPTDADSPFVIRTRGLDTDLFYDSDPEDCTKRRSPLGKEKKSRKLTPRDESRAKGWPDDSFEANYSEAGTFHEYVDINDDRQVYERVQEVMNQRFTMVWHSNAAPIAIVVWIERGQQFGHTLIQPRLVWKRLYDGGASNDRQSVDLLDICRVLEPRNIDRAKYPLAKESNCLLIQSLDETMMFEASDGQERNQLCRDLKLVVARLGSKIIMDDPALFYEFFVEGTMPDDDEALWTVTEDQLF